MVKEVKTTITLSSGKEVDLPTSKLEHKLQNGLRKYPLAAKMAFGCEIPLWLQNPSLSAKWPLGCEMEGGLRKHHVKPVELRALAEETMPPKETTRIEVKVLIQPTQEATTDASAPQDPTIT
ncbi:hypothetical protein AAG906_029773 [Vitis piasezkii]